MVQLQTTAQKTANYHLQVVVHALLSEVIQLQFLEEGLWRLKCHALPLQVVQAKELVQHLLGS